jgi:hypothetical protein
MPEPLTELQALKLAIAALKHTNLFVQEVIDPAVDLLQLIATKVEEFQKNEGVWLQRQRMLGELERSYDCYALHVIGLDDIAVGLADHNRKASREKIAEGCALVGKHWSSEEYQNFVDAVVSRMVDYGMAEVLDPDEEEGDKL